MRAWQEDMLIALEDDSLDEQRIFLHMEAAAQALGFEYCAYGLRLPMPVTRPQIVMLNNYPPGWQKRYADAGYAATDPTIMHGRRTQTPVMWSDSLFADCQGMWDEAKSYGLRFGWAQASLDGHGIGGMLTLARSRGAISATELSVNQVKMRWLVNMAHVALSRRMVPRLAGRPSDELTPREVEVLRWAADGKTGGEISDILHVTEHTVAFHMGNAMRKLDAANKTAAVVKAAVLGLFS